MVTVHDIDFALAPSPTYEVNIDFDEASRLWKLDTAADRPDELKRRQKAYWKKMSSPPLLRVGKRKRTIVYKYTA